MQPQKYLKRAKTRAKNLVCKVSRVEQAIVTFVWLAIHVLLVEIYHFLLPLVKYLCLCSRLCDINY